MSTQVPPLPAHLYVPLLSRALTEDLGRGGDLTSNALIEPDRRGRGRLVARAAGRIAGLSIGCHTFRLLDEQVEVRYRVDDGADVPADTELAVVTGSARAILSGERTALNVLGRLSGIATATREMVRAVAIHRAHIVDTRKTTPGMRVLEKYAVRVGGGFNHRFGLDDAVLIKDNHLALSDGIEEAVKRVRETLGHMVKVEVEVRSLDEVRRAVTAGADAVLLDNMDLEEMAQAVELVGGKVVVEASGGVTPESVAEVAATGVDVISSGWLTHSAPALDVALDLEGG